MIYELKKPIKTNNGWYVSVKGHKLLYLRPSLSVRMGTGMNSEYDENGKMTNEETNDTGYWSTKQKANDAITEYKKLHCIYNQTDLICAYNFGKLLIEQRMNTWTFKFLWMNFTSNPNRKKPYGFNSTTWIIQDITTLDKIGFILSGRMYKIK